MKSHSHLQFALMAVALLWGVFLIDLVLPMDLRIYGVRPRTPAGMWGILWAPLLHANFHHLLANSGALFVLLLVSLSYSRKLTYTALIVIVVVSGVMIWLFGRPGTVHIGASGVIFGLLGYLLCIGLFRREWVALLLSVIIFLLYGGALLSFFIYMPGVSWTGHFFGFVSGVAAAWSTRRRGKR